ncbi:hypothetical protein ACIBCM_25140 [Streptomyces sp. NPDC051018]|uniref:hypothetical protein n=1 Tax=Streptomyces sp. NPDC051018 TaxID=3365639 RepID=UPI00379F0192
MSTPETPEIVATYLARTRAALDDAGLPHEIRVYWTHHRDRPARIRLDGTIHIDNDLWSGYRKLTLGWEWHPTPYPPFRPGRSWEWGDSNGICIDLRQPLPVHGFAPPATVAAALLTLATTGGSGGPRPGVWEYADRLATALGEEAAPPEPAPVRPLDRSRWPWRDGAPKP